MRGMNKMKNRHKLLNITLSIFCLMVILSNNKLNASRITTNNQGWAATEKFQYLKDYARSLGCNNGIEYNAHYSRDYDLYYTGKYPYAYVNKLGGATYMGPRYERIDVLYNGNTMTRREVSTDGTNANNYELKLNVQSPLTLENTYMIDEGLYIEMGGNVGGVMQYGGAQRRVDSVEVGNGIRFGGSNRCILETEVSPMAFPGFTTDSPPYNDEGREGNKIRGLGDTDIYNIDTNYWHDYSSKYGSEDTGAKQAVNTESSAADIKFFYRVLNSRVGNNTYFRVINDPSSGRAIYNLGLKDEVGYGHNYSSQHLNYYGMGLIGEGNNSGKHHVWGLGHDDASDILYNYIAHNTIFGCTIYAGGVLRDPWGNPNLLTVDGAGRTFNRFATESSKVVIGKTASYITFNTIFNNLESPGGNKYGLHKDAKLNWGGSLQNSGKGNNGTVSYLDVWGTKISAEEIKVDNSTYVGGRITQTYYNDPQGSYMGSYDRNGIFRGTYRNSSNPVTRTSNINYVTDGSWHLTHTGDARTSSNGGIEGTTSGGNNSGIKYVTTLAFPRNGTKNGCGTVAAETYGGIDDGMYDTYTVIFGQRSGTSATKNSGVYSLLWRAVDPRLDNTYKTGYVNNGWTINNPNSRVVTDSTGFKLDVLVGKEYVNAISAQTESLIRSGSMNVNDNNALKIKPGYENYQASLTAQYTPKQYSVVYHTDYGSVYDVNKGKFVTGYIDELDTKGLLRSNNITLSGTDSSGRMTIKYDQTVNASTSFAKATSNNGTYKTNSHKEGETNTCKWFVGYKGTDGKWHCDYTTNLFTYLTNLNNKRNASGLVKLDMPVTLNSTLTAQDLNRKPEIHVFTSWEPEKVEFTLKPNAGHVYVADSGAWYGSIANGGLYTDLNSDGQYNELINKTNPQNNWTKKIYVSKVLKDLELIKYSDGTDNGGTFEYPTCTGYNFEGWYIYRDNGDGKIDENDFIYWYDKEAGLVDSNGKLNFVNGLRVTLYAKWLPKQYTILYNGNNNWNGAQITNINNKLIPDDISDGITHDGNVDKVETGWIYYNKTITLFDGFKRDDTDKSNQPLKQENHGDLDKSDGLDDWQLLGYHVGSDKGVKEVGSTQTDFGGKYNLTPSNRIRGLTDGTSITLTGIWRRSVAVLFDANGGQTSKYVSGYMYNSDNDITFDVPYGDLHQSSGKSSLFRKEGYRFIGWSFDDSVEEPRIFNENTATIGSNLNTIGRITGAFDVTNNWVDGNSGFVPLDDNLSKRNGSVYDVTLGSSIQGMNKYPNVVKLGGLPDKNYDFYGDLSNDNGFSRSDKITVENSTVAWAMYEPTFRANLTFSIQNDARKSVTYNIVKEDNGTQSINRTYVMTGEGGFVKTVPVNNIGISGSYDTLTRGASGNSFNISFLDGSYGSGMGTLVEMRMDSGVLADRVVQVYKTKNDGLNGGLTGLAPIYNAGTSILYDIPDFDENASYGFKRDNTISTILTGETAPVARLSYKQYIPLYLHYNVNPNASDRNFLDAPMFGNNGKYVVNTTVSKLSFYFSLHKVGGQYTSEVLGLPIGLEINASEISRNPGNGDDPDNPTPNPGKKDPSVPDGVGGGVKSTLELPQS